MKNFIVFFISPFIVCAQNLLHNPSFENTKKCVYTFNQFEFLDKWSSPSIGTPDLFNSCTTELVGIPKNFHGIQDAVDGNKYAGFYAFAGESNEYIQGELKEKLKKNKRYKISFHVSLSDNSTVALEKINFILSSHKLEFKEENNINKYNLDPKFNHIFTTDTNYIEDKENWTIVNSYITAKGNEQYIILGNFEEKPNIKKISNKDFELAYYYIDNISIESIENKNKFEANKEIIFENVNFKFNSTELSVLAKKEINQLAIHLVENKKLKVIIAGHTDNSGTSNLNRKLSKKRAQAVSQHLIQNGINKERVEVIGYGSKHPLQSNKTPQGKATNRRVSFKILNE